MDNAGKQNQAEIKEQFATLARKDYEAQSYGNGVFPLVKDLETLKKQDVTWKEICDKAGLDYHPAI
jgi:hypothetical protein